MDKTVSIVIPVHNGERFLEETLACVKAQTYTDWIAYLVEDGSTDGSLALMHKLASEDERIRVLVNTGDIHMAAMARNVGIEAADTRYLAFLDNDDYWEPTKLEKQINLLTEKDAAFCFTNYEFTDSNLVPDGRLVKVPEKIDYKEALYNTTIFTSTVLLDMSKLDKEWVHMPGLQSEDTATWWQILRHIPYAYGLRENMVLYRQSAGSVSSNKFIMIKRIWVLYRTQAHLGVLHSALLMPRWAIRATLRRLGKKRSQK